MLAGVNDHVEHACGSPRLLHGHAFKVNLIPYNPTGTYDGLLPRGDRRVPAALLAARVPATVRLTAAATSRRLRPARRGRLLEG